VVVGEGRGGVWRDGRGRGGTMVMVGRGNGGGRGRLDASGG